jgi:hypothetical protein
MVPVNGSKSLHSRFPTHLFPEGSLVISLNYNHLIRKQILLDDLIFSFVLAAVILRSFLNGFSKSKQPFFKYFNSNRVKQQQHQSLFFQASWIA